jgi:uncharacterized OB-fold protein
MSQTVPFPPPTPTPVSQPFWDGAAERRLRYQRCGSCEAAVFPPRAHCPRCWSAELTWHDSSGRAHLAARAVVHRPGHAAFAELAPYPLALVDLEEGFRMLSRLTGPGAAHVPIGAPLVLSWEDQGDQTLPVFAAKEKR